MAAGLLLLKVTFILSLALMLDVYLRGRAVLACAAMWNTVLLAMVLLPACALVLPSLKLPVLPASDPLDEIASTSLSPPDNRVERDSLSPDRVLAPPASAENLIELTPVGAREKVVFDFPWSIAIASLYFVGVGVCLLRLVIGLIAVRSVFAASVPVTSTGWQTAFAYWKSHLACGPVELRQSSNAEQPLMAGLFRPTVLLPEHLVADLAPESRDAVVVHELAHVLRMDFGWHLLLRLVQAALWFHPLIWLAERRIHFIRERACDEFSVHALGSSERYAETLLAIASRIKGRPRLSLGLAVVRSPYIAARIEALAGSRGIVRCQLPTDRRIFALVSCLAFSTFVGSLSVVEAQQSSAKGHTEAQSPASTTSVAAKTQPINDSGKTASADKAPAKEGELGDQEAPTREMRVRVLGIDEEPLSGATVFANVTLADPVRINNREYKCDAKGEVILKLPIEPIDMLRLWADREGRVGWHAHWWPKYQTDGQLIPDDYTFRLEKGTVIGGIVHNEAGQPIEGAKVSVSLVQPLASDFKVRTFRSIYLAELDDRHDTRRTTDAAGRWSLEKVPAGDDVEVLLKISHPNYLGDEEWGGLQKAQRITMKSLRERTGTVVMRRSPQNDGIKQAVAIKKQSEPAISAQAAISGQAALANGSPVAGATVFLRDGGLHQATTDEQGRFEFAKAPLANYEIWAVKESLVAELQRLTAEQPAAEGGQRFAPVRLSMSQGKEIHVNVTSTTTGQPLKWARVELDYPYRQHQTTDKDGKAVLTGLLAQPHRMSVEADGHALVRQQFDLRNANSITEHKETLAPGGTVRGVVSDETGQPLANARVSYLTPGSPVGFYGDSPYAEKDGAFRNLHLPLDTPVRLMVSLKDYESHREELTVTAQQPDLTVKIQLKRRPLGGSVAGIVTDSEGQPVAGASVTNYGDNPENKRETKTDHVGRFLLDDVRSNFAGHELLVRAAGLVPVRKRFEPTNSGAPRDLAIKLEKGHSIRARVENNAGQPLAGAYVDVNGGSYFGQTGESLRTDNKGEFISHSLPQGSTFRIYCEGYSSINKANLTLDSGETALVKLEAAGIIHGRITELATREAIPQFRVRLAFSSDERAGDVKGSYSSELGDPGLTMQSRDGAFSITNLTSRMPFKVTVDAEGYEQAVLPRVVAQPEVAAEPVTISLKKRELQNLAELSGKVIDHNGKPVGGVQLRLIVSASPSNGDNDNRFNWALIDSGHLGQKGYVEQYLSAITDDGGKFELKELLPGKFLQLAYWGKRAPKGRTLAIGKTKPGATQTITVQLPEPTTIRGSFDTEAFPNASRISLTHQDQPFHRYEHALAKGQSESEFEDVPPGRYWLSVVGQPERHADNPQMFSLRPLASRRLTVEPGKLLEVHLTKEDQSQGAKQ